MTIHVCSNLRNMYYIQRSTWEWLHFHYKVKVSRSSRSIHYIILLLCKRWTYLPHQTIISYTYNIGYLGLIVVELMDLHYSDRLVGWVLLNYWFPSLYSCYLHSIAQAPQGLSFIHPFELHGKLLYSHLRAKLSSQFNNLFIVSQSITITYST